MNMTPDEIIAVVQAHKEGKEIELQPKGVAPMGWAYTTDPVWDFYHFNYRVKPKLHLDDIRYLYCGRAGKSVRCSGDNLRLTFDGETGKLKSAEVLP